MAGPPVAPSEPPKTRNPCLRKPSATAPCADVLGEMTTLMLRNIPNNYEPDRMLELLDAEGFVGQYDFVFLPRDFKSRRLLGYGFVNFIAPADALRAFQVFTDFTNWRCCSKKTCQAQWSRTQGYEANVKAVQTSPSMRKQMPDNFKPVLFQNGVRIN